MIAGGWGVVEIQPRHSQIVEEVKAHINTSLGAGHHTLTIVEVRQQVVAGTNYHFVLLTECGKKISVKVYEPLPHTHQPISVTLAEYI